MRKMFLVMVILAAIFFAANLPAMALDINEIPSTPTTEATPAEVEEDPDFREYTPTPVETPAAEQCPQPVEQRIPEIRTETRYINGEEVRVQVLGIQNKISGLELKNAEQDLSIQKLQDATGKNTVGVDSLSKRADKLGESIEKLRKETEKKLYGVGTSVDDHEKRIIELETTVKNQVANYENLNETVTVNGTRLDAAEQSIKDYGTRLTDAEKKIGGAEKRLDSLKIFYWVSGILAVILIGLIIGLAGRINERKVGPC